MRERIKILDAHTHIGPDNYQLKLGKGGFDVSIEQLSTTLTENKIEGAIVMCSSSTYTVCPNPACLSPSGPMEVIEKEPFTLQCRDCGVFVQTNPYFEDNLNLFEGCKNHPQLLPFLTVDLRYPFLKNYVDYFSSRFKVYGIKTNCFAIRSSPLVLMKHKELVNSLQKQDVPLLIHATDGDFPPEDALQLSNITGLRVAIAHGPKLEDKLLEKISASGGTYIDVSPFLALCRRYKWEPEIRARQILDIVDYKKVIFGSDIPFTADYPKEIEFWENLGLDEKVKRHILSSNAFNFLGIRPVF